MSQFEFEAADGVKLVGTLDLPDTRPAAVVIAAHGASGGTRGAMLHQHLSSFLPREGIGTFIFDRRGEGESGGEADQPLAVLAADVAVAVSAVSDRPDVDRLRVGVWGHSQGGWIAPLAAARTSAIRCMVVVSGSGVSPRRQMEYAIANVLSETGYEEEIERALALRDRVMAASLGRGDDELAEDLAAVEDEPWFGLASLPRAGELSSAEPFEDDLDIRPVLATLHIPALLTFGERDRWVPIEESEKVWRGSYGSPEQLTVVRLPGTQHFPTLSRDPTDVDERGPVSADYERALARWLHRHLA